MTFLTLLSASVCLCCDGQREMREDERQHRTRTFLTYDEISRMLIDMASPTYHGLPPVTDGRLTRSCLVLGWLVVWQGGHVSREELEYVFGEDCPGGITFSQLVMTVNDILYTGYTNVRLLAGVPRSQSSSCD